MRPLKMTGLSSKMAQWANGFRLADAPEPVIENAKLHILDIIGVMIASNSHETVALARKAQADADGGEGGAFALMGSQPLSPAGAAFINGVASAVLEFDDTHTVSNIHPTGVVVSASLPIAQAKGLSGREWLEAVIVGLELLCRIGLVSPVRMHEVGMHPTSVYGVFGAAYSVSRLRGLSDAQTADAVGTAASLSAGSIASFEDGTSTKTLHVGFAAASAIRAVAVAAHGLSGPKRVFEGKFGWFKSHIQSQPDFHYSVLTQGLGQHWEMLNIAPKFFPCAYTLMPFISAALALQDEHTIDPKAVKEIRCEIMPRSFQTVCEPLSEKRRPLTSWHGRISLQHSVAEAIAMGRFDKFAYAPENLRDPIINALADKVVHVPDPVAAADISRSRGVVTVQFKDGREISHTVEDMLGTRSNPANEAHYVSKFRANVDGAIAAKKAERLVDAILHLETATIDDVFLQLRS